MVERLVLLKLSDPGRREPLAAEARRVLPGLPGVRAVIVGIPADADAEVWDLLIAVRFDRLEDIAIYCDHPDHVAFAETTLAPFVAVRKAWNFVLTE